MPRRVVRIAQLLTVIALGGCAVLLAVGSMWFFTPARATPTATQTTLVQVPYSCERPATVRDGNALSAAFDVDLEKRDRVCLVESEDVTVVYSTSDEQAPADPLFAVSNGLSSADLRQLGLEAED